MTTQDTCTDKCKFWKRYKENCPFYIETQWQSKEGGIINHRDCAPKRSVLMQMDMHNRLLGMQNAAEKERNKQHEVFKWLIGFTGEVVNQFPQVTVNVEDVVDILEIPAIEEETNADNNNKLQRDTAEDSPPSIG